MHSGIGVIDLFAGPGGLGEGFSAYTTRNGSKPFQIHASVECEPSAHKTLQLRAFFRQFGDRVPEIYYQYLRGEAEKEELFAAFPAESMAMAAETLNGPRTLGDNSDDRMIHRRVAEIRKRHDGPLIVIGGPPCQAYSLVGRARNKGVKGYRADKDNKHFLYREYLKILDIAQPDVFVMENVKGLLSSRVNGDRIFDKLLEDLRNPSRAVGKSRSRKRYRIHSLVPGTQSDGLTDHGSADFLLKSERFGVPQARHRVIIVGVSEELSSVPASLVHASHAATVAEALKGIPRIRSGISRGGDSPGEWQKIVLAGMRRAGKLAGIDAGEIARYVHQIKTVS